jgi:2-keto-3-deoxy-L-rhamnonate aldolase RhmA
MAGSFVLTAISCDPEVVRAADLAGVDRIGVDIERLGKDLRQNRAAGDRFSDHTLEDLRAVAATVTRARVFIRINPLHDETPREIDTALACGAHVVMLPYFTRPAEAGRFLDFIGGRAEAVLLLETAEAAARIREIAALPGATEIMVGLNDLRRSLGLAHPFEVLASETMATIAREVAHAGLRFGFGGVGRSDDESLAIPPSLVHAYYPLLGATAAWLARSFYRGIAPTQIPEAVRRLRQDLDTWFAAPRDALAEARDRLAARLAAMQERNA